MVRRGFTPPLDLAVSPIYEYTLRSGSSFDEAATSLVRAVTLPGAVAQHDSAGRPWVEAHLLPRTRPPLLVMDAVFRLDPGPASGSPGASPAIASDVLVRTAVLEWPSTVAVVAAGTRFVRARSSPERHGARSVRFYMDWRRHLDRGGYMEAGPSGRDRDARSSADAASGRAPAPVRVESPQPLAANPISSMRASSERVELSKRGCRAPTSSSPDGAPEAPRLPDLAGRKRLQVPRG